MDNISRLYGRMIPWLDIDKSAMLRVVRQPATLASLATDALAVWVAWRAVPAAAAAEPLVTRAVLLVRAYLLRHLPADFYDDLAAVVQRNIDHRSFCVQSEAREALKRMIETLFTDHLTRLRIYRYKFNAPFGSFPRHLAELDLYVDCTELASEGNIIQFLSQLHHLRFLSLCCFGDSSNILRCAVENCKYIERLKLLYTPDSKYQKIDVMRIIQFKYLNTIRVSDAEVNVEEIETLLMCCENMEHVVLIPRGIPSDALTRAVVRLASRRPRKRLNLKSYQNGGRTTLRQLTLLVTMCPLLQTVYLQRYHRTNCINLNIYESHGSLVTALTALQDLRELCLTKFAFYADGVERALARAGRRLEVLHLVDVAQVDTNALMCISEASPNLQTLGLLWCGFKEKPVKYSRWFCKEKPATPVRNPPFGNLRKLYVLIWAGGSELVGAQVRLLLGGRRLRELHTENLRLPEPLVLAAVDEGALLRLRELALDAFLTTELAVRRILETCRRPPEVLMFTPPRSGCCPDRDIWQYRVTQKFTK